MVLLAMTKLAEALAVAEALVLMPGLEDDDDDPEIVPDGVVLGCCPWLKPPATVEATTNTIIRRDIFFIRLQSSFLNAAPPIRGA
jgi:hypothetical protein